MKYNWNSTRKTKKKNLLGFNPTTYYPLKPQKHEKLLFFLGGGYFVDVGTNVEFNDFVWFCEFLKVSGSIFWLKTVSSLYLLVKNSFNFKLGFLLILNLIQGALAEKKFLTDYHSTR